ncbi:MAG TPA: aldo/keto reductase [Tepidisphaeraceae bacterium]|nr:aldo/keto reductase [Tepidisphaeraceae bacterium]
MHPRKLGPSAVHVSPVVFGAWAIGGWMWGGNDEQDSLDAIRASIDHGVNTIDTAAIYGQGYSEELVGRAITGRRDKVVIATKCGRRWDSGKGSDPWPTKDRKGVDVTITSDSRPSSIFYECEQSLKRLGTDVIDVYQIHWPDRTTAIEEAMGAMDALRRQGKIRAIGVSNFDLELLKRAKVAAPALASVQPPYSLIQRRIEKDGSLAFCRENNVGVLCYSPLERGLLAGTVPPERQFKEGDHRATHRFFTTENRQRVLDALQRIRPIAETKGVSLAQLVINWTIHQPGITAALVGARNAEQATHNAGAMNFTLTSDELGQIRHAFDDVSAAMM